jgi:short subunit dehydrogenase-like uncharacterized protein
VSPTRPPQPPHRRATASGRGAPGPDPWLLYGAYGYTGRLLASEALRRDHRPILAGRDRAKLEEGSPDPGLPLRAFPLHDAAALREGIRGVRAVLHAAGPFVETARPMMEACLAEGVHYLDVTGEVPVFEMAFDFDARAREAGVVLMPGVGMDVIPTDGAAALLAEALPGAVRLELALHSPGRPSAGTLQTVLEGIPGGLLVRRGGRLLRRSPGRREFRRRIDFGPEVGEGPMAGRLGGERWVAPYTWGDLSTAWRTTGIGDITCYSTTPAAQVRLLPFVLPVLRGLLAVGPVRRWARRRVAGGPEGPSPEARRTGRTRVWGRVEDAEGRSAEVVLEFPEGYRFTGIAGVRALEAVLALDGAGALTPAGAFGAEWVLGLPEVEVVSLDVAET